MPLELQQYLEDFDDDLTAAHKAYLKDCAILEKGGDSLAGMALRLAVGLQITSNVSIKLSREAMRPPR
jgi:hypothetical protein